MEHACNGDLILFASEKVRLDEVGTFCEALKENGGTCFERFEVGEYFEYLKSHQDSSDKGNRYSCELVSVCCSTRKYLEDQY